MSKKAFSYYLKLAESGDAEAQCLIGDAFSSGILFERAFEKNAQTSQKWYLKAAEQNNAYAQEKLAEIYYNGFTTSTNPIEKNHKEALKWYKKLAENGDVSAQNIIAKMYYDGDGVEQNFELAFEWYFKLAEQGNTSAQRKIADMLYNGYGVWQNHEAAFFWFSILADKGDASAQSKIAKMYYDGDGIEQNFELAFYWAKKSAGYGNDFTKIYHEDDYECIQDLEIANELEKEQARHSNDLAQNTLADMYYYGNGIKQNYHRAFFHYMIIAKSTEFPDIKNLIKWLNKMLDKGEIERGDCVKTDLKLLFKFFKKKSEKTKYYGNYNDFEFALGQMYETGKGTLKSIWRAIKAYTNAHNYGNEKAITAIKRLGQTYPETKRLIEKMLNRWNAKK